VNQNGYELPETPRSAATLLNEVGSASLPHSALDH
jgi:hypothetical protein